MTFCRMHYNARLLIDEYQIIIFIDDIERNVFGLKIAGLFRQPYANYITDPGPYIARSRCSVQIYKLLILHLGSEPR